MSGSININVSGIACSITSAGISAPSYAFILSYLQAQYQAIYGSDVVLTSDTQDGQWLAILATAFNDVNAATIAAYNNQSPATAQGAGLSSVIKINGLTREVPTNSTMPVAIGGTFPTTITNGVVVDSNNYAWNLPATVDIPSGGTVTVTAICQTPGAIAAAPQTLRIQNPQRGWQTAANATSATPGVAVELDGALRIRQAQSTQNASQTVLAAMEGQLAALNGVGRMNVIENTTGSTDANGVPAHNVAVVIEGGNSEDIGLIILQQKGPGGGTYGAIEVPFSDEYDNPQNIYYSAPTEVEITIQITLLASTIPGGGYTTVIGAQIQAAVASYISTLPIGKPIYLNRLMLPANLYGGAGSTTYDIVSIEMCRYGGTPGTSNITLAFNEAPTCSATTDVTIVAT
jgi:uncharacterized phage protein gp47/JayE